MGAVVPIAGKMHAPTGLRDIANGIEEGRFSGDSVTVIAGTDVFHLGCLNDAQAAQEAIWNMTFGIHKLMNSALAAKEG